MSNYCEYCLKAKGEEKNVKERLQKCKQQTFEKRVS